MIGELRGRFAIGSGTLDDGDLFFRVIQCGVETAEVTPRHVTVGTLIEENFDVSFIAGLALREKQIQQNYRPVIAVHKWFARRPGTLFRGLLLSEFTSGSLRDSFYKPHNLKGIRIADPFMGGGTPLL